jgi:hypothetical protein
MTMKIRIDERTYEGSGAEIMEQLRQQTFDPGEFPDTESYICQLRSNFIRATDLECVLPNGDTERQSRTMFAHLARAGALTILEE